MKKIIIILYLLLTGGIMTISGAEVFFVPGWRTGFSKRALCVEVLQRIYPGMRISIKSWDSMGSYQEASRRAQDFCESFKHELLALPEARRRELIVIGHSIGARIVLDVMTELKKRGMQVREVVLLGAAFPRGEERVWDILEVSRTYCYSVVFPDDVLLKIGYTAGEFKLAQGSSGWKYRDSRFIEKKVRKALRFSNHYAYLYLEAFETLRRDVPPPSLRVERILYGGKKYHWDRDGIYWKPVERFENWQLERHFLRDEYRIIDPDQAVRAVGSAARMRESFADIKNQLLGGKK